MLFKLEKTSQSKHCIKNFHRLDTHCGPPLRMVPSPLQTMSVRASPENWAIHPILDRKKQMLMKNKI